MIGALIEEGKRYREWDRERERERMGQGEHDVMRKAEGWCVYKTKSVRDFQQH
jgi:hypothetical protein